MLLWPAFENAPGLLVVESGQQRAQALVVLGGGTPERQTKAIELYKAGVARLIVSTGDGEAETARYLYLKNGVRESDLVVEGQSKSTWENAKYTAPILRERGLTNVILVTSWFHSRRAMWTFQRVAPDIQFHSCPTYWGARRDLWEPCGLRRYIILEFIKTPWYWLRGLVGR